LLADAAAEEDPEDSQPTNPAAAKANAMPVNLVFICVFTIVILFRFNFLGSTSVDLTFVYLTFVSLRLNKFSFI
jgi:hypothetical protein